MKSDFLLDTNVLLAIAWPNHQFHDRASRWFTTHAKHGWASCAITELGFVRLSANPAFTPHAVQPEAAVELLGLMRCRGKHRFLASPPLQEGDFARALGHKQVTDACLLAVATAHRARLVTFDGRIGAQASAATRVLLLES